MNEKERLIELLHVSVCDCDCEKCEYSVSDEICIRHLEEMAADHLIAHGVTVQQWIPVEEGTPDEFVSVLGHMTDAGDFPAVRECYMDGGVFFFPALREFHPVDKWMPMPA